MPEGEAIVSWTVPPNIGPSGILGFRAHLNGVRLPLSDVPLAAMPGERVKMHLRRGKGTLSIQSVTGGGCNGRTLPCGQTVNGSITKKSEIVAYRLAGNAGEHLILSASGFGSMVADVYDPTGGNIASIGPSGTANLALATTGDYTVLVHASNYSDAGGYGLTLTVFGGCTQLYLGMVVGRTQQVACVPLRLVASTAA